MIWLYVVLLTVTHAGEMTYAATWTQSPAACMEARISAESKIAHDAHMHRTVGPSAGFYDWVGLYHNCPPDPALDYPDEHWEYVDDSEVSE